MNQFDVVRYHNAVRMIEDDMNEAYFSCRDKYGSDVAGVILVALLRQELRENNNWPPDDSLFQKVNEFLAEKGILNV